MKTLDKVIIAVAVFLALFIIANEVIFCIKDAIPDTLVSCVLGAGLGEVILTTVITVYKIKHKKENADETDDE